MLYHRLMFSSTSGGWPVWTGTQDGSVITAGLDAGFTSSSSFGSVNTIAGFGDNQYAAHLYAEWSGSQSTIRARLLSVSGNVISVVGTTTLFSVANGTSVTNQPLSLFPFNDGSGRILAYYSYIDNITFNVNMVFTILTRSGSSIIVGNQISVINGDTLLNISAAFYNSGSNCIFCAEWTGTQIMAWLLSFSGTTISFNGPLSGFDNTSFLIPKAVGINNDINPSIVRITNTTFLLITGTNASNTVNARIITLTGTTPSYGTVFTLGTTDSRMASTAGLVSVNSSGAFYTFNPVSTSTINSSFINVSGTTITGRTNINTTSGSSVSGYYMNLIYVDSTNVLLGYNTALVFNLNNGVSSYSIHGPVSPPVNPSGIRVGIGKVSDLSTVLSTFVNNATGYAYKVLYAP